MESLQQQVAQLLEQQPTLLPAAMAEQLNVTEFDIVHALPEEMVAVVDGSHAQTILESLPEWGPVTTIMTIAGSILKSKHLSKRESCTGLLQFNGS